MFSKNIVDLWVKGIGNEIIYLFTYKNVELLQFVWYNYYMLNLKLHL